MRGQYDLFVMNFWVVEATCGCDSSGVMAVTGGFSPPLDPLYWLGGQ